MDRQRFIDMAQIEVSKPNRFGGQFAKSKLIRASDGTNHSEAIFSSDDGQAIAVVKIDRDNGLYIKVYRESTSIIGMVDTDAEQPKQDEEDFRVNSDELFADAEKFLKNEFHPNEFEKVFDGGKMKTALQRRFRIGYVRASHLVNDVLIHWYQEGIKPYEPKDELFYAAKELIFSETTAETISDAVKTGKIVVMLQMKYNIDYVRASALLREVLSVV